MSKTTEILLIGLGIIIIGYMLRSYNESVANGIIVIGWLIGTLWALMMGAKYFSK